MIEVAVVGATGAVGQQLVAALDHHPWFRITRLCASERSVGKTYGDALRDDQGAVHWYGPEDLPKNAAAMTVEDSGASIHGEWASYFQRCRVRWRGKSRRPMP